MIQIKSSGYRSKHAKSIRIRAFVILLILMGSFLLPACFFGQDDESDILPADYGKYGEQIAITLAENYPNRESFSQQQRDAGLFVKEEFEKLGYEVEEQVFNNFDRTKQSINYYVRIAGEGFMERTDGEEYLPVRKTVIVGAHYDCSVPELMEDVVSLHDGIQDNASGIGCLLTLAKEMYGKTFGYDVILVAFSGGSASYAGAEAFVDAMTLDEISSTEAMYCIESIYAGDKLYASAGHNSLQSGKKYEKRRKLYEAYDVVYDNMLNSLNNVDLYYNMSGILLDIDGDEISDVYREITLSESDYIPFDKVGIPIVFFESYDYNFTSLEEMKETKNLNLQEEGGQIRGTGYDSYVILSEQLDEERLMDRINNTAFIILEAIKKGSHNSVTVSEYEAGITLEPYEKETKVSISESA